jgi:hypothetical protein
MLRAARVWVAACCWPNVGSGARLAPGSLSGSCAAWAGWPTKRRTAASIVAAAAYASTILLVETKFFLQLGTYMEIVCCSLASVPRCAHCAPYCSAKPANSQCTIWIFMRFRDLPKPTHFTLHPHQRVAIISVTPRRRYHHIRRRYYRRWRSEAPLVYSFEFSHSLPHQ